MLGAEGVMDVLVQFLEIHLPAQCTAIEQRLTLAAGSIPPPAEYSTTDLPDLDAIPAFPALILQVPRDPQEMTLDDENGIDLSFSVNYGVRLHVLNRSRKADDIPGAELGRYRLKLALIETFLLHPSLGGGPIRLVQRRITGENGNYMRDRSDRVISPGYLDLPVVATETLTQPPLIPAADPPTVPPIDVNVIVEPLP